MNISRGSAKARVLTEGREGEGEREKGGKREGRQGCIASGCFCLSPLNLLLHLPAFLISRNPLSSPPPLPLLSGGGAVDAAPL